MTDATVPARAVRPTGQALIPLALVLLVGLVAWLTYGARSAERSHRATAESALRDYAAFAGWEFSRRAQEMLSPRVHGSLGKVRELRVAPGGDLPSAAFLSPGASNCGCGFGADTRFAFRFDLTTRTYDIPEPVSASTRTAVHRLTPMFLASVDAGLGRSAQRGSDALDGWVRLAVDTLAGEQLVVGHTVMYDAAGTARAVYGVAVAAGSLTKVFDCPMTKHALLPPSLVGGAPNDSILRLRVSTPAGAVLYERGGAVTEALAASDTMPAWTGGLVVTVALRPETAASLLIGGMPPSRLPTYFTLLAAAVLVSVLALVQLRRGRELALLRSQFVANVSHELRTPLAQISMFSETLMLDRERSAEERRHFLSVILREARRLTHLVEGVLRFSRGEAGASAVRPESRDVAADVAETVAGFGPLAAAADATVEFHPSAAAYAWADAGAVRQIVLNLLDNAVKYGPPGQTVTVGIASTESDVTVFVEDQGVGIPAADRHRVFEPFARLERAGTPRVSGSGIGLSVVRDLVAAHGGQVWIGSAPGGRGTRVSFTLTASDATVQSHGSAATIPVSDLEMPELQRA